MNPAITHAENQDKTHHNKIVETADEEKNLKSRQRIQTRYAQRNKDRNDRSIFIRCYASQKTVEIYL